MSRVPDYYAILGVHPEAEYEVIAAAYKALAKKYHPDTGGDSASSKRFVDVQEAYEVLRDDERRRDYDKQREAESASQKAFDEASGEGGSRVRPGRRATSSSSPSEAIRTKPSATFLLLLAGLLIASVALIAEITHTIQSPEWFAETERPTEDLDEASVSGMANQTGKSGLSDGLESQDATVLNISNIKQKKSIFDLFEKDQQRLSGSAPDAQQNMTNKPINDRIVGEDNVAGSADGDILSKPVPVNEGKGSFSTIPPLPEARPVQTIPKALQSPPPPLPIPGTDQQG